MAVKTSKRDFKEHLKKLAVGSSSIFAMYYLLQGIIMALLSISPSEDSSRLQVIGIASLIVGILFALVCIFNRKRLKEMGMI